MMSATWKNNYDQSGQNTEVPKITLTTKVHIVIVWFSQLYLITMKVGSLKIKKNKEEFMYLNCGAGEDCWEYLGPQDQPIIEY